MTTSETAKRRLCHLDIKMARYNEEWSIVDIDAANDASSNDRHPLAKPMSLMAVVALRTTQEEAERIIRGRQAAARKPCHDAATFRHPKHDDNAGSGVDDGGGAACQPKGMAYEITVTYWIV